MVDAQPLDDTVPDEFEDLAVGGVEDLRVLDPHGDQVRDGEEPPIVQLGAGQPPPAEPVVLGVQQSGQCQVLGARAQRELLLSVAQHRPVDGEPSQLVADGAPEHGQQHLSAAALPVDVEPAGVRRGRPLAEHLPQRPVVARGRGHVVRHDVDDQPHPVRAGRRREFAQPLLAAQLGADPAGIGDVVPVARPGHRLQDGGQVEMGDTERSEVRDGLPGVREGEVRLELEPVRGGGRHDRLSTHSRPVRVIRRAPGCPRPHGCTRRNSPGRRARDTAPAPAVRALRRGA